MDIVLIILCAAILAALLFLITAQARSRRELQQKALQAEQEAQARFMEALERNRIEHETRIQTINQQWEQRIKLIEEQTQLQFRTLGESVLTSASEKLRDDNKSQLDTIVQPLHLLMDSLQKSLKDVQVSSTATGKAIDARIDDLIRANNMITTEARNLARALKGEVKKQGDWGEMILSTILERAGLKEGINYDLQVMTDKNGTVFRDDSGSAVRPDALLYLPQGDILIIDSKVSLTAYLRYTETDDEEQKKQFAKAHVASMRKHVLELADLKYPKAVKGALDHVLMFVPNEAAWIAANEFDPDLWQYADAHKVTIVSLTHLLSVIHLIAQLWRHDSQDKNAAEIARIAGLIYDSTSRFLLKFDKIGSSIDSSRALWEEVRKMLEQSNPQSIVARAKKLKELGAKTSKNFD